MQARVEKIGDHRLAQARIIGTGFRLSIDRRETDTDTGKVQSCILKPEDRVAFRLGPGDARCTKPYLGVTHSLDEYPTGLLCFRFGCCRNGDLIMR